MSLLDAIAKWVPNGLALKIWARYEGARYSVERSWIPTTVQAPRWDATQGTRMTLVAKAQYFEKNQGMFNRMADLFEQYVVGQGLEVQPASSDEAWNEAAKEDWENWSRIPDLTTLQSLGTLEGMIARRWFVDGESFVLKTKGGSGEPRLQVVDSYRVETPPDLRENPNVVDGVLLDANGRPAGYYITREDSKGTKVYGPAIPWQSIRHVWEPDRPGQLRGLPFCTSVINKLHDLDDLHILQMRKSKGSAQIKNVIKTESGEIPNAEQLRAERITGSRVLSTGSSVADTKVKYYKEAIGDETIVLRRGDDFAQYQDNQPSVAVRDYWKGLAEEICAGCGFPYVIVFPDSMQGTVYRGSLDMAASFFRNRFLVMRDLVQDLYIYRMQWARYRVPELQDAPADWKKVTIHAPRSVNVDVGRNSAAVISEIAAGLTNWEIECGKLGLDYRDVFRGLMQQQALAREMNLVLTIAGKPAAKEPEPEPEPEPETQEEPSNV